RRVKGKTNIVPDGDVAGGLSVFRQVAAFQVAKVANIVDRRGLPRLHQGRLFLRRQRRPLGEERIKNYSSAFVRLPPYSKVAGKILSHGVHRLALGLYCHTAGRGAATSG